MLHDMCSICIQLINIPAIKFSVSVIDILNDDEPFNDKSG